PAGLATGRQSVFKGVISAIAMFFGFYALSILSMILAKNSLAPAIPAAWFANVMFLIIGAIMFYRQR
ncbi:MAG: LptF/LptG family permease, partial [Kiritimatiellae bacterium]|nr:LptF/LptG family permease [Kiritimatiellia bacterium]MDD4026375.1 LptF/LptG family permease [Kiritimatiellia bacterium]